MDSQDYFVRAERSDRIYRRVMFIIGLFVIVALVVTVFTLFDINATNHRNVITEDQIITQNEVKLNQNQDNALQCVLDLTPQTYSPTAIHQCFNVSDNIQSPNVK